MEAIVNEFRDDMLFSTAVLLETTLEKTLQAAEQMLWPMVFGIAGTVVNLILDPIMIFGLLGFPELGLKGAALTTGIIQI